MAKATRPVQIRIDEETFTIIRVYAATKGMTANEMIADLARKLAERVRVDVSAVLGQ